MGATTRGRLTAREHFFAAYGRDSRNMMTPRRLAIGWLARGTHSYELSEGEGIPPRRGEPAPALYGVSVAGPGGQKYGGPESQCFDTRAAADEHVRALRRRFGGKD
jgi:hypothetical protein